MTTIIYPEDWYMEDPPSAFNPDPEPLPPEENLEAETAEYRLNHEA